MEWIAERDSPHIKVTFRSDLSDGTDVSCTCSHCPSCNKNGNGHQMLTVECLQANVLVSHRLCSSTITISVNEQLLFSAVEPGPAGTYRVR